MEDTLKKVVNIGIGAIKSLQENYGDNFKDLGDKFEARINDFESKGAKADDNISAKIKQGIDEFIGFVNKYQTSHHEDAEPAKKTKTETKTKKKTTTKKTE